MEFGPTFRDPCFKVLSVGLLLQPFWRVLDGGAFCLSVALSDERVVGAGWLLRNNLFSSVAHRNNEVLAAPCVRKREEAGRMGGDDDAITLPAPPCCGSTDVVCPSLLVLWSSSGATPQSPTSLYNTASRPCLQGARNRDRMTTTHASRTRASMQRDESFFTSIAR